MLTLRALGAMDIRDGAGEPLTAVLAQPKRAGLLAYLLLSHRGGFHRRDSLLALFWPEMDQQRGRAALSQALTFLRRNVGEGVLTTRGAEEVGVDARGVRSDVADFEEAVTREDWIAAVDLYRGDLLEGLHVAGSDPFLDWVDRERLRLREQAGGAAWTRVHQLLGEGRPTEAERMAQRALYLLPTDESPVRAFIQELADAGDRAAAVRFYERFAEILEHELDVRPAPETVAVMEAARQRAEPVPTAARLTKPPSPPAVSSPPAVGSAPVASRPTSAWRRVAATLGILGLGAMGAYLLRGPTASPSRASTASGPTLAVLPFEELTADSAQVGLGPGMTEELTASLAKVRGLKVISHPSVAALGNRPSSVPEIGRALGADLLVEGSVLVMGDDVRVTTQLVVASTNHHVWSGSYDGSLSEVLGFLSKVARSVAGQVEVVLTADDERRLAVAPTANPQVMAAMLRARSLLEHETPDNVDRAIRLLDEALNLDPAFAPAWGLMALAQSARGSWFADSEGGEDIDPLVERAARRALALDHGDPDALAALAQTLEDRFQWEEALRTYQMILARDPSYAWAGVSMANTLTWMGRYDEALAAARKAVDIDPLSAVTHQEVGNVLFEARRPEEAWPWLKKVIALDAGDVNVRMLTAAYLVSVGECHRGDDPALRELGIEDAVGETDRLLRVAEHPSAWMLSVAVWIYTQCGYRDRALEVYHALEAQADSAYVSPLQRARAKVAIGEMDGVLDLLEEGLASREPEIRTITNGEGFQPLRDSLRGNPRFEAVVDRIGLPRSPLKWSVPPGDG